MTERVPGDPGDPYENQLDDFEEEDLREQMSDTRERLETIIEKMPKPQKSQNLTNVVPFKK